MLLVELERSLAVALEAQNGARLHSRLSEFASVPDRASQVLANTSLELDDHEHIVRHVEIGQGQSSRMRRLESEVF